MPRHAVRHRRAVTTLTATAALAVLSAFGRNRNFSKSVLVLHRLSRTGA
ncbi:MAG: hypothetical protein WA707_23390 [Pseudolabrys sp.]